MREVSPQFAEKLQMSVHQKPDAMIWPNDEVSQRNPCQMDVCITMPEAMMLMPMTQYSSEPSSTNCSSRTGGSISTSTSRRTKRKQE